MSLRAMVERDLATTLEGADWAATVRLTPPSGESFEAKGQVLYNIVRLDPVMGERITVNTEVVTLRRSTLVQVPQPGERWLIEIPATPMDGAPLVPRVLSGDRPPQGGAALGFIRLYLQEAEQTEAES